MECFLSIVPPLTVVSVTPVPRSSPFGLGEVQSHQSRPTAAKTSRWDSSVSSPPVLNTEAGNLLFAFISLPFCDVANCSSLFLVFPWKILVAVHFYCVYTPVHFLPLPSGFRPRLPAFLTKTQTTTHPHTYRRVSSCRLALFLWNMGSNLENLKRY